LSAQEVDDIIGPIRMDYQAALTFLQGLTDWERSPAQVLAPQNYDLRRVRSLLARLSNPHLGRSTVHIAGSKGKGSTAAMVASILKAAGYLTGLYTSPHLHSFCERIASDGEPISPADFARLTAIVASAVEAENSEARYGRVTTFEALTALAFLYFREREGWPLAMPIGPRHGESPLATAGGHARIEKGGGLWQVLEVGMGGRLDATNVVDDKDVCIITALGLEHTAVLGDTVDKIAAEKAAILRPGVPVVLAPQSYPEATAVVKATAAKLGAPVVDVARAYRWQVVGRTLEGQSLRLWGPRGQYELWLPLLGSHQVENAACAIAAVELLQVQGLQLPAGALAQGLSAVRWPGRLEVLQREPLLVADGAHSGESARRLAQALREHFAFDRLILVIGTAGDKDIAAIAGELAPLAQRVIATRSRHPRAAAPETVAAAFAREGIAVQMAEDVERALATAMAEAGTRDLICAAGSLHLVAEAREALLRAPAPLAGP